MPGLPDPFDVEQLRRQAKELRAAAMAGDRLARERIRQSHPRFGRRRLADADLAGFTLRDAQLCIARELGFDGWRDVLAHAQGASDVSRIWRRWPNTPSYDLFSRAARVSRDANHGHIGPEHALGALLRVETPTVAAEVLSELGITWEVWINRQRRPAVEEEGQTASPAWYGLVGCAEGLALADGADAVKDEHVLLALTYNRSSQFADSLDDFGVDPDGVVVALGRRGVAVSDLRPPVAAPELGPFGPRVYFPAEEYSTVTRALTERFPPGTGHWGWNTDGAGRYWIDGEADLNLEDVVRSVVQDPDAVEVQPLRQALEEDRRRWHS